MSCLIPSIDRKSWDLLGLYFGFIECPLCGETNITAITKAVKGPRDACWYLPNLIKVLHTIGKMGRYPVDVSD